MNGLRNVIPQNVVIEDYVLTREESQVVGPSFILYELDGQALHTPSLTVAPTVGSVIFDGELNALPDVHVFTVMVRQRSAVLVDLNLPG